MKVLIIKCNKKAYEILKYSLMKFFSVIMKVLIINYNKENQWNTKNTLKFFFFVFFCPFFSFFSFSSSPVRLAGWPTTSWQPTGAKSILDVVPEGLIWLHPTVVTSTGLDLTFFDVDEPLADEGRGGRRTKRIFLSLTIKYLLTFEIYKWTHHINNFYFKRNHLPFIILHNNTPKSNFPSFFFFFGQLLASLVTGLAIQSGWIRPFEAIFGLRFVLKF